MLSSDLNSINLNKDLFNFTNSCAIPFLLYTGGTGASTISDQKAKVPTNRDQDRTNVPSLPKKDSFKASGNESPSVDRNQGQGQFQFKSQKLIQEKQFLQQVTKDGGTDKQFLGKR